MKVRLALARHRRVLVAVLLGLAVATGLQTVRPAVPSTTAVLVAARDLPTGHRLAATDLVPRDWPEQDVPAGLLSRPQGQVLAAPLRRGEPVTDVRVTPGRSSTADQLPSSWVSMPVRLSDPAGTLLVVPGDRVEVIVSSGEPPGAASPQIDSSTAGDPGTAGDSGTPHVVVDDALVLATPSVPASPEGDLSGGTPGGLLGAFSGGSPGDSPRDSPGDGQLPAGVLELGLPRDGAVDLAAAAGTGYLTIARHLGKRADNELTSSSTS